MAVDTILLAFLGTLLLLYAIGVPIAIALGATSVFVMLLPIGPSFNPGIISNQLLHGLNSFVMLAVPFYLMLGRLMNRTGMTENVFEFANSLVGQFRSGIAQVNILASLIFSGMSGLAVADAAGLGRVEYTSMREYDYDKSTAIGVTGTSSIIGPIIPPSVPIILFAVLAQESIGSLFLAGIIPGVLLALFLSLFVYAVVLKNGPGKTGSFDFGECYRSFVSALPALAIPIFIIAGITTGMFTPTEAGALAVLYTLLLGFVNGDLTPGSMVKEFRGGMVETFAILFIIGIAMLYGLVALQLGIPTLLAETVLATTTNQTAVLFLFVGLFLLLGTFMSITATIMIMTPIVMPVIQQVGIDPIHFGIVMILTLMLGVVTPPLGSVLFVLEKVTDATLKEVMKAVIPYYIPILLVVLLIVFFPDLTTWIPYNLAG
ncbi:permease [Halarchaeum grantii]|uniref:Permease n=1 Tax=Halarchaeum grantii TaxID=1193105 RepID=A0A830EXG0_9EURY|nr:TRAP transporter large permease [Halarchaeum grantii]GGL39053.1 permease [Halarchaeum grantii]